MVSAFGALAASAAVEHGVGEFLQGPVAPASLAFESWPDARTFEVLGGEPAMTVVPDLQVTGVLAIVVGIAMGVWAVWFIQRPRGGLVLIGLSILLLLVGGGFGPPLIGIILGVAAHGIGRERGEAPGRLGWALARTWAWVLAAGLLGYLSLVPGLVVLSGLTGFADASLVLALTAFSFAALILAIVAARAHDSLAREPRASPAATTR